MALTPTVSATLVPVANRGKGDPLGYYVAAYDQSGDVSGGTVTIKMNLPSHLAVMPLWVSGYTDDTANCAAIQFRIGTGVANRLAPYSSLDMFDQREMGQVVGNLKGASWGVDPRWVLRADPSRNAYASVKFPTNTNGKTYYANMIALAWDPAALAQMPFQQIARYLS